MGPKCGSTYRIKKHLELLHEQRINVQCIKKPLNSNNSEKIQMKWINEWNRQISNGEIK